MTQLQNGIYNIINVAGQQLLDSKGSQDTESGICCTRNGSDEGTLTQQAGLFTIPAEPSLMAQVQWRIMFLDGTSICKIQSVSSRLYCGIEEDKPSENSPVILTTAQAIFSIEGSTGKFLIKIPYQELLLTYTEGVLHLARANGSPQQLWHLQYFGILQSGTYNIVNAIQRRALDAVCPQGASIIAYPLNSMPHGTNNQKWKLRFLKGTTLCTMQVLDPNTFLSKRDEMSLEDSEVVGGPNPTVVSFNSVGNGNFSITIPYQNLALSINSLQGISVFDTHPWVYFCQYNGADGQLWRLELIDPPNDAYSGPQRA